MKRLDLFAKVHSLGFQLCRQARELSLSQPQRARLTSPVDCKREDLSEQLNPAKDLIAPDCDVANTGHDQGAGALFSDTNRHADRRPNSIHALVRGVEDFHGKIVGHLHHTHAIAMKETDNVRGEWTVSVMTDRKSVV